MGGRPSYDHRADHGNDPTYTGTDHTREKVPFLAYSPSMKGQGELPEAETFPVIGGTILDNFGLKKEENMIGDPFWKNWSEDFFRVASGGVGGPGRNEKTMGSGYKSMNNDLTKGSHHRGTDPVWIPLFLGQLLQQF